MCVVCGGKQQVLLKTDKRFFMTFRRCRIEVIKMMGGQVMEEKGEVVSISVMKSE